MSEIPTDNYYYKLQFEQFPFLIIETIKVEFYLSGYSLSQNFIK